MREFLNDLLEPQSPIRHVTFLNKDVEPDNDSLRGVIYDMRCQTEDGKEIIVEMQNRSQTYFNDRIIYYLANSIAPQGFKGKKEKENDEEKIVRESWDFNLKPVYGIFFLNFHLDGLEPRLVRTVKFTVNETNEVFNDKVRAYTIELPCMKGKTIQDCKEKMDYWSYNLYNMETMNTQMAFTDQRPIFMKMAEVASYHNMTLEQQETYMDSLNRYRTFVACTEYDYSRGKKDGIEIGMEKGERKATLATARNLKALGIPAETIAQATGLSVEEIEGL